MRFPHTIDYSAHARLVAHKHSPVVRHFTLQQATYNFHSQFKTPRLVGERNQNSPTLRRRSSERTIKRYTCTSTYAYLHLCRAHSVRMCVCVFEIQVIRTRRRHDAPDDATIDECVRARARCEWERNAHSTHSHTHTTHTENYRTQNQNRAHARDLRLRLCCSAGAGFLETNGQTRFLSRDHDDANELKVEQRLSAQTLASRRSRTARELLSR